MAPFFNQHGKRAVLKYQHLFVALCKSAACRDLLRHHPKSWKNVGQLAARLHLRTIEEIQLK